MLSIFKPTRAQGDPELTLTFEDHGVTVTSSGALAGFLDASMTWPLVDGTYPQVDSIIRKAFENTDSEPSCLKGEGSMNHPSTATRVRNVAAQMERSALGFEAAALAAPCPLTRDALDLAADTLHQYARQVMGDIGEGQEEYEVEPLTAPSVPEPQRVPAQPVGVPA